MQRIRLLLRLKGGIASGCREHSEYFLFACFSVLGHVCANSGFNLKSQLAHLHMRASLNSIACLLFAHRSDIGVLLKFTNALGS